MQIKERLKQERKARHLTQEEIAKHLFIQRASYAKYETGANMPTCDNLNRLADLYNVSTDYLLCRTDSPRPPTKKRKARTTRREAAGETINEE